MSTKENTAYSKAEEEKKAEQEKEPEKYTCPICGVFYSTDGTHPYEHEPIEETK